MDDTAMKKLEDTLVTAKFAPKLPGVNPSITDLLQQWDEHMKALHDLHNQMKDAWSRVANHAINIGKEIER